MLTLFACPKPFLDPHIELIQRNAVASWVALRPRPVIILFGEEKGIAEVSAEFGLVHVPAVARNTLGTPVVSDVFRQAETMASQGALCYVNADIILMDDFMDAIRLCAPRRRWLMGGRPWNLSIRQPIAFNVGWQERLSREARTRGTPRSLTACDYFAFSTGQWRNLPELAIGRSYFDNALLYRARGHGAELIDATLSVVAIHQSHDFPVSLSGELSNGNPEAQDNVRLAGGWGNLYTLENATHRIIGGAVRRWWWGTLRTWGPCSPRMRKLRANVWYPVLGWTKPARQLLGLDHARIVGAVDQLKKLTHRTATGGDNAG